MFKKGDSVQIKPEWQDEGDEEFSRFVIEDEDRGAVKIMTIIPGWTINPTEWIDASKLDRK
ncbi:MAG: hypothetical protein ACXW34_11040 [Nitrospira sp.]